MKNDPRSCDRNFYNCVKKPEKNSGLQRGLNLWPREYRATLYQLSYEATAPNVSGFIAQLVERRTGIREVTGSSPVEVLNFFQASLRNCKNCDHNCEDHSSFDFISALHMIYFICIIQKQKCSLSTQMTSLYYVQS